MQPAFSSVFTMGYLPSRMGPPPSFGALNQEPAEPNARKASVCCPVLGSYVLHSICLELDGHMHPVSNEAYKEEFGAFGQVAFLVEITGTVMSEKVGANIS